MGLQGKLNEWLAFSIRLIGAVGLVYEIFVDHLQNATALVVFGGLAGLPDVLGYRAQVKTQVERKVHEEEEHTRT